MAAQSDANKKRASSALTLRSVQVDPTNSFTYLVTFDLKVGDSVGQVTRRAIMNHGNRVSAPRLDEIEIEAKVLILRELAVFGA